MKPTQIGICILQDGLFRSANAELATLLGYCSADELLGQPLNAILGTPEDRHRVESDTEALLAGKVSAIQHAFCQRRADGTRIEIEMHGQPFPFEGRPAVLGIWLDITQRKRVEWQKPVRGEPLSALLDVATGEVSWSEGIYRLLGYDPNERIDFATLNAHINHPEDMERITDW